MTLAIDGIVFSLQRHGGISVYFRELIRVLAQRAQSATLTLETPLQQDVAAFGASVDIVRRPARRLERFQRARTPADARVFHSSYYRLPATRGLPTVVTVYDFIYERYRKGPGRWAHMAQKRAAIRAAQAVICISESTREDLLHWIGETPGQQVHVTHLGVSPIFRPLGLPPAARPYMLYVGERGGYKNFSLALQALALLPEFDLHCVGGGALRVDELAGLDAALRKRVRHLGYVTDEELNAHYNSALCLLYPSRYEGFGIPVVEAMSAGCPVVSIACKAVLEAGGDALTVADAEDPQAVATAILRTADSGHRAATIQAGLAKATTYSWDMTHAKTLDIYRGLGAGW